MHNKLSSIKETCTLLKGIYLPLIEEYVKREITPQEFENGYITAFQTYSVPSDVPDDLYLSVSTVFMDIDAYWSNYNPNDPEDTAYLESHSNYIITEEELYKRCTQSYKFMLDILAKYS